MPDYLVNAWRRQAVRRVLRADSAEQAAVRARDLSPAHWAEWDAGGAEIDPFSIRVTELLDVGSPEALARYREASGCVCPRCGGGAIRRIGGADLAAINSVIHIIQEEACDDCGWRWRVRLEIAELIDWGAEE